MRKEGRPVVVDDVEGIVVVVGEVVVVGGGVVPSNGWIYGSGKTSWFCDSLLSSDHGSVKPIYAFANRAWSRRRNWRRSDICRTDSITDYASSPNSTTKCEMS